MDEARAWAAEVTALSPTTLRFLKMSFNADSAQVAGQQRLAFEALELLGKTAEAEEGRTAFTEKRPPDFSKFR
jgi:naphthoate synthase